MLFFKLLDLHVIQGNLHGIVHHFDNHPLADRQIFMDDKARLHRACIVREFRQQEAIDTFQGPAVSLDMNPIEHVWDFIGLAVKLTNIIHNVKILLN
jgi:transposase